MVGDDGDYSDDMWNQSDEPLVIAADDPVLDEDPTDPPEATDDSADPAELDDTTIAYAVTQTTYQNPVDPHCADPGVIRVDRANGPLYIATCTGNGFPMYKSTDLVHWAAAGHIFNTTTKPKWGGGNWWAPEIHHVGDHFVAYFVALSPRRNKMCIGAATATSVMGPYTDLGHPLVCDRHVSLIDPNMMTLDDGRHVLYYKTDGNAIGEKTIIYGQMLTDDGVGLSGARHRLIENTLGWEGDVVEAPWVMKRGGYYYMFYSGYRYCNQTYGVGIARSRSPLGPFYKKSAPILHSNDKWSGPGHNSVTTAGGHDYMVYHAWQGSHSCSDGGSRVLMLDRIHWTGGWPYMENASPSRGVKTSPTP
jgi:beta-xylosidase